MKYFILHSNRKTRAMVEAKDEAEAQTKMEKWLSAAMPPGTNLKEFAVVTRAQMRVRAMNKQPL